MQHATRVASGGAPQEDGPGFLASCPTLQGCHAEGDTVGPAWDHDQAVAEAWWALRREDGMDPETVAD